MISEKKASQKRYRLLSFLLSAAAAVAVISFIVFGNETATVKAGSPFIYDNGGLSTGPVSDSGVNAPAGTEWSEAQHPTGDTTVANTVAGVSCSVTTTVFRCADDFTVPAGQTWTIDQVVTFAYQTGFAGATSPITGATLRIWNGRPGDGASTVIFGDTTTNRLASSTSTNLWRIFNSVVPAGTNPPTAPATNRRLWQNHIAVSPALELTAGTYWVDWNTQIGATTAHFAPAVTVPGTRGLPGWNARQFTTTWVDVVDSGQTPAGNPTPPSVPQDFPFKLVGSIDGGGAVSQKPNVDFDGDGTSDYSVVRDETPPTLSAKRGSGIFGAKSVRERMQLRNALPKTGARNLGDAPPVGTDMVWYINNSENNGATVFGHGDPFQDFVVPADFDGDDRADFAVWRSVSSGEPSGNAFFYVLNSADSTFETIDFGQEGDNPTITGDYDGDGEADPAVYRCPTAGGQCFYFYLGSAGGGETTYVPWGNGEPFDLFPYAGDFDGDGRQDFCVQREDPDISGQGQFVIFRSSDSAIEFINWGLATDLIVPGDFDGDGQSDITVGRNESGQRVWYILERDGGMSLGIPFGLSGDYITPGDYDGDGATDISVFRPDPDPGNNFYYVLRSSDQSVSAFEWGIEVDYPLANWQVQ